jgi:hypothetical protein
MPMNKVVGQLFVDFIELHSWIMTTAAINAWASQQYFSICIDSVRRVFAGLVPASQVARSLRNLSPAAMVIFANRGVTLRAQRVAWDLGERSADQHIGLLVIGCARQLIERSSGLRASH